MNEERIGKRGEVISKLFLRRNPAVHGTADDVGEGQDFPFMTRYSGATAARTQYGWSIRLVNTVASTSAPRKKTLQKHLANVPHLCCICKCSIELLGQQGYMTPSMQTIAREYLRTRTNHQSSSTTYIRSDINRCTTYSRSSAKVLEQQSLCSNTFTDTMGSLGTVRMFCWTKYSH